MLEKVSLAIGTMLLALVVSAVLASETQQVSHELHVTAPSAVRFGDPLPVRAQLFSLADQVQGPRLIAAPVQVRVVDRAGRDVVTELLTPTRMNASEGLITIPRQAGEFTLVARATADGVEASVHTQVRVLSRDEVLDAPPVRMRAPIAPPAEIRIGGGACIAELPCEIFVNVGALLSQAIATERIMGGPSLLSTCDRIPLDARPAIVTQVANDSFTPDPSRALVDRYDYARIVGTVHGLDAQTGVSIKMHGECEVVREFRVPVALGQPYLTIDAKASPVAFRIAGIAPSSPVILDLFRRDAWIETRTIAMPADGSPIAWPFHESPHGVLCVQARTDVFSSEAAATRCLSFDEPDASIAALGWGGAFRETGAFGTPQSVSGLDGAEAALEVRKARVRTIAGVFVAVLAAIVTLYAYGRGRRAAQQARDLMAEAGDESAKSKARIRKDFWSLLLIVGLIAAAVLSTIAFLLARRWI